MRRSFVALVLVLMVALSAAGAGRRRAVGHPAPPPPRPAPVAAADAYSVNQGSTLTIAAPGVLANDALHEAILGGFGASTGTEQTVLGSTAATAHGVVSLSAAGGFTYTPSSAFSGTDTFRYTITNSGGSSSATVTITVNATAAVVQAVNDTYTTPPEVPLFVPAPGVLTNDTLAGGRLISFGSKTGAEQTSFAATSPSFRGGVLRMSEDGSFSYTPPPTEDDGYGHERPFAGIDNFFYMIQSGAVTSTGTVNVAVEVPPTGADYIVTTPGHYYAISSLSGENPVLVLQRGKTYTFQINADSIHPFAILDAPAGSVTNNNITQGTITFAVPATAQSYRYRCTTHGFGNVINTVP